MGLFDFLKTKSTLERFADSAMARLVEMGWPHPMRYEADHDRLHLGGEAGMITLADTFRIWSDYPKRERDAALTQAVAFVFELGPPPGYDEAKSSIVPVLRSRALTEAMLYEPWDRPGADPLAGAWKLFSDHLTIHLALDRPHSLIHVSAGDLQEWNRSFDEVLAGAMNNLRGRAELRFELQDGGYHQCVSDDRNEIARLLLPEQFEQAPIRGAPVVVPIARDCVLVAGSEDIIAIETMSEMAHRCLDEHPRPISCAPMILENGQWRNYAPGPGMKFSAALYKLQSAHDYEQQKPLIAGRLERMGRSEEVAPFFLFAEDEGPCTLAIWTSPSALLPRAEFILIKTGKLPTFVRAWNDVESALGGFAVEPDTALPYHLVQAWPDVQAMAKIASAPEPAWAKGRGVGFAGGALSFFG